MARLEQAEHAHDDVATAFIGMRAQSRAPQSSLTLRAPNRHWVARGWHWHRYRARTAVWARELLTLHAPLTAQWGGRTWRGWRRRMRRCVSCTKSSKSYVHRCDLATASAATARAPVIGGRQAMGCRSKRVPLCLTMPRPFSLGVATGIAYSARARHCAPVSRFQFHYIFIYRFYGCIFSVWMLARRRCTKPRPSACALATLKVLSLVPVWKSCSATRPGHSFF